MWRKRINLMVILIISLSINTIYANEAEIQSKQVLVVVVPGFSFEEAQLLVDKGESIWNEAAIGAMNVRPNGPYSYLNNMVTLSAGDKAVGIRGWSSFEAGEIVNGVDIRDWINQTSGDLPDSDIYHPTLNNLMKKNVEHNQLIKLGRLGSLLHEVGVERAVYGHSDTGEEHVRYGSLLVMDEEGKVNGELTRAVKKNPSAPYGIEMDVDYLINKLSTDNEQSQLTVIEWGDLYRLFEQRGFMDDGHFQRMREQQLGHLSSFLERTLLETTTEEIWFIAPMMHKQSYEAKQQLAPIYFWGEGNGFLTSNTTKRPYLVSSLDFIPTILHSFGLPSGKDWTGNVIVTENRKKLDRSHFFNRMNEIFFIYKSRASVLSTYTTCLVLALISAAIFHFFGASKQKTWRYVIRLLLLSALWSPFLFLTLSKFLTWLGVAGFVLTLLCVSGTCGYIVQKVSKKPIFWIGAITFITITLDLFLQSPLMQRSYLGYDPIIGARYYGIGNEFAGIYLISALMLLHPLLSSERKRLTMISCALMLLLLIFVLGKSTLGTNAGAMLSAGIAFSFLFYQVSGFKWSRREISLIVGIGMIGGVIFLYLLQLGGERTHIGTAFLRLLDGDVSYILDIIKRKLAMNVKLFRHSNWTQLLVTSYLLGAVVLWRKQLQLKGRDQQLFLQTGVVASFALLLLNDSGVVAAATSMFCVISTYYYWLSVCGKKNGRESDVQ